MKSFTQFLTSLIYLFLFITPILIAQEGTWDDQFYLGGFYGGEISAIATADNGDIYVGGSFSLVNGVVASKIARWDGEKWTALGSGLSGEGNFVYVNAIEIDGGNVYVGGFFTMAGEVEASNIAKWDGQNWTALRDGTDGEVIALEMDNETLYVGGNFDHADNSIVYNIAKWDGLNWTNLSTGMSGEVITLKYKDNILYAGGGFIRAGSDTVNYIAQWNGQTWSGLGSGMENSVFTMVFDTDTLYAGGRFDHAGGIPANNIAKWNGSTWDSLGSGLNYTVNALEINNSILYVGGGFNKAGTTLINRIARWDGLTWSSLDDGVNDDVNSLLMYNDILLVGGRFDMVNGVTQEYFATWSNSGWSALGLDKDQSVNGEVSAIAVDGNDIYVGGLFVKAAGDTMNNIAKWDGQNWSALGSGLNGKVNTIAAINGVVYAGGAFSHSGELQVNRIAKWDGQNWSSLAEGFNNQVYAVAIHGSDIYAGGNFTSAGTVWARHIARWDGVEWHALGGDGSLTGAGGLDGYANSYVKSIVVSQDTVYIAGYFGSAIYESGFLSVKSVVKWDGENWGTVGTLGAPYNVTVNSMIVENGQIFAATKYPIAGGWPANRVVHWNGADWTAMGEDFYYPQNGTQGDLRSIVRMNDTLYVGGDFVTNSLDALTYLAWWDGSSWKGLESTVNGNVYALAADENYLYAGGRFTIAGNGGSAYFGRYTPGAVSAIIDNDVSLIQTFTLNQNYPNPFNPTTTIKYSVTEMSKVSLILFNLLGQEIITLVNDEKPSGNYSVYFNAVNLSSGVYFYRLQAGAFVDTKKMILLK